MTIVQHFLSPAEAQRLTQRIKLTAGTVRDNLFKLRNLVDEAKSSNVWQVLGFQSWTAYLADTLADEPMRLGREERQELVEYLSGEGLSTRAIAPIVGASQRTVANDLAEEVSNIAHLNEWAFDPVPSLPLREDDSIPADPITVDVDVVTGELIEDAEPVAMAPIAEPVKTITGLDGKTYTTPAPSAPRRKALTDSAKDIGWELRKATEKLQRLAGDDRYTRNKEEVAALIKGHLMFTVEVCQDLLDEFTN